MAVVDEFLERYAREFDFYDQSARLVQRQLSQRLGEAGVRAIVTSRAKEPTRLRAKVVARNEKKNYSTIDSIYADLVDLAGARVALYFPGQRLEVERIIRANFDLAEEPKRFPLLPLPPSSMPSTYEKRFSGYHATHFRVHLKQTALASSEARYAVALVEIQVASVLMHAWSEVEHDLIYKPLQGSLSIEELQILDELNGMVLAGEISLERLQTAGTRRVTEKNAPLNNHYELASYLLEKGVKAKGSTEAIGRVVELFRLLSADAPVTEATLEPYLDRLKDGGEDRPLADQILDQMLSENPARYEELGVVSRMGDAQSDEHFVVGRFTKAWIAFERAFREAMVGQKHIKSASTVLMPSQKAAQMIGLDHGSALRLETIKRLRNHLFHGTESPPLELLVSATDELENLTEEILKIKRID